MSALARLAGDVTADRMMVDAGLPPAPQPLAGLRDGYVWVETGEGYRRHLSFAQARRLYTRHSLAVYDACIAASAARRSYRGDAAAELAAILRIEAYHRRWERCLLAALSRHDEWGRLGDLFAFARARS